MNIIVAGQRIVTDREFIEAALGVDLDLEPVEFGTEAGQDALRGIVAELEHHAENSVDAEDLAYYRSLLGARVVQLPRRSTPRFERRATA